MHRTRLKRISQRLLRFPAACLRQGLVTATGLIPIALLALTPMNCQAAKPTATVGVLSVQNPWFYVNTVGPTLAYLRKRLPQYEFRASELGYDALTQSVAEQKLDFFVAPSGFFSDAASKHGAVAMATQEVPQAPNPAHAVAGVVVVRADSAKYRTLRDLKGATVAANNRNEFGSWVAVMGEIHDLGYKPERFWGASIFTQYQFPGPAALLLAGESDAAVLTGCELERLESEGVVPAGALRVLDSKTTGLACRHSTKTYPGYVFASLPKATAALVKDVSVALLSMPRTENGIGWGVSNDFTAVRDLYRNLQIGPYEYLRQWNPKALWDKYQWIFWLILAVGTAAGIHIVRSDRLVRLRTSELQFAISQRDLAEKQAQTDREKLSQLERAGVVAQLSGMFAHEVQQPVTSIVNFAGGLQQYLDSKSITDPVLHSIGKTISEDALRISEIVTRVRSYAKARTPEKKLVRLDEVLRLALDNFSHSTLGSSQAVECSFLPSASILGDALELELVVVNLLKNAASSAQKAPQPSVRLELTEEHREGLEIWRIAVSDNGPALSDEQFANLRHPMASDKPEGLGLGLSICRLIVERHSGRLIFSRLRPSGIRAEVFLEKAEPDSRSLP